MALQTTLKHADGRLVTAQEAYDAFMTTRVLIDESGRIYLATSIEWYDNNSAQSNPANVGFVIMHYVNNVGTHNSVLVGDSSLKPSEQTT